MKAISSILLLGLLSFLSMSSCTNADPLETERQAEYAEICEGLSGGDFDIDVEGKDWSTECVHAAYTETITASYSQKILYLYAYNFNGTYFSDTDIEVAVIVWAETTVNGETTIDQAAAFYRGLYDYSQAINNPDYELEEVLTYSSDEDNMDDMLTITALNENTISGNLNFELLEEDSGEAINMSGSFTANIVQ